MESIFSGLPNDIISHIIQIENDRKNYEKERMKYEEVIKQLNRLAPLDWRMLLHHLRVV